MHLDTTIGISLLVLACCSFVRATDECTSSVNCHNSGQSVFDKILHEQHFEKPEDQKRRYFKNPSKLLTKQLQSIKMKDKLKHLIILKSIYRKLSKARDPNSQLDDTAWRNTKQKLARLLDRNNVDLKKVKSKLMKQLSFSEEKTRY